MRQFVPQDFQRRGEHDRAACAVVGPQAGRLVGRLDEVAFLSRLAADAQRHGVHVREEQSPRGT
jgi:hypothetical protein